MNFNIAYKIIFSFFLISQYEQIMNQDNFLAIFTYILLMLILLVDMVQYLYKMYLKK